MPELEVLTDQCPTEVRDRERSASDQRTCNWTFLPYELWLMILVDYGLDSKDFANLDYCCKWFGSTWRGRQIICNSRVME